MSEIQIAMTAGTSKRLHTAGKYCPQNIVVTADNGEADGIIEKTVTKVFNATATSVGPYLFYNCSLLTQVAFSAVKEVKAYGFYNCTAMETAEFTALESIGGYALRGCKALTALVLRTGAVVELSNANAFADTPIESGRGFVYVPDDLLEDYQTAANWSNFAKQIKPLSQWEAEPFL